MVGAAGAGAGTWLVRPSSSERGGLSFTVRESDGGVRHYRLSRAGGGGGGYVLRLRGREEAYDGLREAVVGAVQSLRLTQPVLGLPTAVAVQGQTVNGVGPTRFAIAQAKQVFMEEVHALMPPVM